MPGRRTEIDPAASIGAWVTLDYNSRGVHYNVPRSRLCPDRVVSTVTPAPFSRGLHFESTSLNETPVRVARISWPDLFPWLLIFRALPVALSITVLVLATLGVAITPMGWLASESLFITDEIREQDPILAEIAELNRSPYRGLFRESESQLGMIRIGGVRLNGPRAVFERMVRPFRALFGGAESWPEYGYYLVGCLWTVLVWAFVGTGITRVCLLRMTRDERAGLDDAFEYGFAHYLSALGAILLPMIAVLFLAVPGFLFGLLMGLEWGVIAAGVLWFVVLGFAVIMGVLLLGLMFGWPLMICSVASEGQNAFDAITRAYAYVFQRPVNYAFYVFVAIVFGAGCWIVATQFTHGVINLAWWSTGLGAERVAPGRIDELRGDTWGDDVGLESEILAHHQKRALLPMSFAPMIDATASRPMARESRSALQEPSPESGGVDVGPTESPTPVAPDALPGEMGRMPADERADENDSGIDARSPTLRRGVQVLNFWIGMAKTVCVAFIYGLFWCLASAVYLLMRHDVDDTPMDEIHVVDQQRTYELPPLKSDEKGIPQIQPITDRAGSESPRSNQADES